MVLEGSVQQADNRVRVIATSSMRPRRSVRPALKSSAASTTCSPRRTRSRAKSVDGSGRVAGTEPGRGVHAGSRGLPCVQAGPARLEVVLCGRLASGDRALSAGHRARSAVCDRARGAGQCLQLSGPLFVDEADLAFAVAGARPSGRWSSTTRWPPRTRNWRSRSSAATGTGTARSASSGGPESRSR